MNSVAQNLGFKIERYRPEREHWGTFTNGTYDGLEGELQFNRAQLGWANLFQKYDKERY